jgi:hypothetical protein
VRNINITINVSVITVNIPYYIDQIQITTRRQVFYNITLTTHKTCVAKMTSL